jgi:PAS domain S-box-containing protein
VNDAWTETFGYSHAEAMANSAMKLVFWANPDDWSAFLDIMKNNDLPTHGFETKIRAKSGKELIVIAFGEYVEVNNEVMLFMVFHDITERKKSEATNIKLARIVEDSINEVFVFDAETLMFLEVNASACRNTGYTAEELAGLTPVDLKPEFTLEQFEDAIAPLRRGEQDHFRFQTIHRRKDGSHYDTDIVLQQIKSGGQPVFAAIVEDITDRKRAEKELLQHRDHLQEMVDLATQELKGKAEDLKAALSKEQELNKLQREFVSMASHEFRTPLAIIDSTAQRMKSLANKSKLTPEDAVQRIDKIREAVQRMTRLMESTLDAARMEEGKIEVEIKPCDIGKVVSDVCARQQEISKSHVISCDLSSLPVTIQADTGSVEQVLTNLLSNAVKYAPDAPDIEVVGRTEGDQAVISVHDHGIGIDEDDLPSIGERFFRAKTSTGTAGTGIGLNLVKTLVEMHDGTINFESTKGEGSTFTIFLPIAGPEQKEQADTRAA